jgi:hypothetical protein
MNSFVDRHKKKKSLDRRKPFEKKLDQIDIELTINSEGFVDLNFLYKLLCVHGLDIVEKK